MIVRNEAAVLERLAGSVTGFIDHWTIVDTGSTDDTASVARRCFDGVPGQLIDDEWRGFGPSRNAALEAAGPKTDWLLSLDADHTFHGSLDAALLASDLDGVDIEEHYDNLRYWLPRLVRSGRGWRWVGRTHEYLTMGHGADRRARASNCWVEHHADGGSRASKFQRDIELLSQDWAEHPNEPRTAFYLGPTRAAGCSGKPGESARGEPNRSPSWPRPIASKVSGRWLGRRASWASPTAGRGRRSQRRVQRFVSRVGTPCSSIWRHRSGA
jgi:glycosyltransferase involved in cell wall biosynthesis